MNYRAYKFEAGEWLPQGTHSTRVAAIKAVGKSGAVVYDCGTRKFLSTLKPFYLSVDHVLNLRDQYEDGELTI